MGARNELTPVASELASWATSTTATASGSLAPASVSVFTAACVSKAIAGRVARAPKATGQGREMRGQPGSPPTGGRNAGGGVLAPCPAPDPGSSSGHCPGESRPRPGAGGFAGGHGLSRGDRRLQDRITGRSVNVGPASASPRPTGTSSGRRSPNPPGRAPRPRSTRTAPDRPPAVAAEDRAPPPRPTSG